MRQIDAGHVIKNKIRLNQRVNNRGIIRYYSPAGPAQGRFSEVIWLIFNIHGSGLSQNILM